MEVFICSDPLAVGERAAAVVLDALQKPAGEFPVLGVATGSSPLMLYAELGRLASEGEFDPTGVRAFALDEYVGLPKEHPESYWSTLMRTVCDTIGVLPENLHVPNGEAATEAELRARAADYDDRIDATGGIDVQILGIGTNGHLGFNEPGSSLSSRTRVKRLSAQTRTDNQRFFDDRDVPTHCVTQGLGTIRRARKLVLIATGAGKASAVEAAVEGPLTASCPASILQWHEHAVVVADEDAASALKNREYYDLAAAGM